jgi:hypothetical protein
LAKKKVKITRADGVRQTYHVGSDIAVPTATPTAPVYADEFGGGAGSEGYEGITSAYERFLGSKTATLDPIKARYPIGSVHTPTEDVERELPRGTIVIDTIKEYDGTVRKSVWMKSGRVEGWTQLASQIPVDVNGSPVINEDLRTEIKRFAGSSLILSNKDVTSLARSGANWTVYDFAE